MRLKSISVAVIFLQAFFILSVIMPFDVHAQMMPGMEPEERQTAQAGEETDAAGKTEDDDAGLIFKYYKKFLGEGSPYRGVIFAVLTLIILLAIKKHTTRMLRRYAESRAQKSENIEIFMKGWNSIWKFVIAVFVILALSGSLQLLGLSAAFLGMMLGWSLQAPVTGLAAWLMIILKRPFRIGDRVIIAGVIGDVTDITLTHVILNQVGGTVGGEERSGRGVLIPNAILFNHIITNYTLAEQYMLDEVPVRLTFDSDWGLAKELLLRAATDVTGDIIEKSGQSPFVRVEFFDAGVLVRLRYQSIPARRQEISSLITERLLEEFKNNYPKVKFCYPHSVVRYKVSRD